MPVKVCGVVCGVHLLHSWSVVGACDVFLLLFNFLVGQHAKLLVRCTLCKSYHRIAPVIWDRSPQYRASLEAKLADRPKLEREYPLVLRVKVI